MSKKTPKLKWTHELEIDLWNAIDKCEESTSCENIWKHMLNKDIVTKEQIDSHLRYINKFEQNVFNNREIYIPLIEDNCVFSCIDIETTGFGRTAQIISIAVVSSHPNIDEYYCYILPTKKISRGASKVNGFTTKSDINGNIHLYKNRRPVNSIGREDALVQLVSLLQNINENTKETHYLLAHNGHVADFPWLFREFIENNVYYEEVFSTMFLCDTMKWAKEFPDLFKYVKNEDIYKFCYRDTFDAHDALADAKATLSWTLSNKFYGYINSLKTTHCIQFGAYLENFLINECVLKTKDSIDIRLETPTIMAYETRKKIAKSSTLETLDNLVKESDTVNQFHEGISGTTNIRKSTSAKVYHNLENIEIIPKWICSNCGRRMKEYTSKKEWSVGRKFYACFKHNQFNWKDEAIINKPIVHSIERYNTIWNIQENFPGSWFIDKTLHDKTDTISFNSKSKEIIYNTIDLLYKRLIE